MGIVWVIPRGKMPSLSGQASQSIPPSQGVLSKHNTRFTLRLLRDQDDVVMPGIPTCMDRQSHEETPRARSA